MFARFDKVLKNSRIIFLLTTCLGEDVGRDRDGAAQQPDGEDDQEVVELARLGRQGTDDDLGT